MTDPARTAPLVLAAGAGSRFGGAKLLAELGGRPLLDHALALATGSGLADTLVVVGPGAPGIEALAAARGARVVRNPHPERGLSSSVRLGLAELEHRARGGEPLDAAIVLLGDQPRTSPATVQGLLAAAVPAGRSIVIPRYQGGGGANPALLLRAAWALAAELEGDHGFGPLIKAHPELVVELELPGDNPDVDSRADLARVMAAAWSDRVLANREQVERVREVSDGNDFYAPVRSLFRADPTRVDDPVVDVLLGLLEPGDRWLDVGAGAGRFALPLARALEPSGGEVLALDASPSMLEGLREIAAEHDIRNVRTIEGRWPLGERAEALTVRSDVALIAHVGYDVAEIGPFIDALETTARRACVAVLMDRVPASVADPFWPLVHGQARAGLPALADFVELLAARGRRAEVVRLPNEGRVYDSRAALEGFARRRLWIDPAGPKEVLFQAALKELAVSDGAGWLIGGRMPNEIGVVTWRP